MIRSRLLTLFRCAMVSASIFLLMPTLSAQEGVTFEMQQQDSVVYKTKFYFAENQSWWIDKMNPREIMFLVLGVKDNSDIKVKIEGWANTIGDEQINSKFARNRAITAQRYLVKEGIETERISYKGVGIDFEASNEEGRRADVIAFVPVMRKVEIVVPEPEPEPEPEPVVVPEPEPAPIVVPEPEPVVVPEPEPVVAVQPEPEPEQVNEKWICNIVEQVELRTNLLYWAFGMFNVGVELDIKNLPVNIVLNGGYSPFGGDGWAKSMGGWFVAPEVRYYLPRNDRWFVGAQFLAQGYNFKLSDNGYQGHVIGAGVLGGYKMPISRHFDMDFTLGVGYGSFKYDKYYHEDGINILMNEGVKRGRVTPIQVGVNLIWKID